MRASDGGYLRSVFLSKQPAHIINNIGNNYVTDFTITAREYRRT